MAYREIVRMCALSWKDGNVRAGKPWLEPKRQQGLACSGCQHLNRWQIQWPNGLRRMWFSCSLHAIENPECRCSCHEQRSELQSRGDFEGLEDFYEAFELQA